MAKWVLFIGALFGIALTAERVILVNGTSYPRALADDAGSVDLAELQRLRTTTCKDEPIEVFPKNGYWILRCGFSYYQGHTFVSRTDPFGKPAN